MQFSGKGRKGAVLILITLLLFAVSGCWSAPKKILPATQLGGFLGGDVGLLIKSIEGAPPSVIQDRSLTPFSFLLTLENVGEAKVGKGTDNPVIIARLLGIVHKDFGLTVENAARRIEGPLEPAKRNIDGTITPGEITDAIWDGMVFKPGVAESLALTIRAEVCYDYESFATTKICMKKDFVESAEDATICMLRGPREFGNSGAPLHVTAVEQAPVNPTTIQLNFRVEHFGRGVFFYRNEPKDNYDACAFDDLNPNIYKVDVFVEPVQKGTYEVECLRLEEELEGGGVHGVVRSNLGAPISMTCFIKRTTETEQRIYEDLVNIKLKYRYGEFIEVPILIQSHP